MKKTFLILTLCLRASMLPAAENSTPKMVNMKMNPPLILAGEKEGIIELNRLGDIIEHVDRRGTLGKGQGIRSARFTISIPNQPQITTTLIRPLPNVSSRNLTAILDYAGAGQLNATIKLFYRKPAQNTEIEKAILTKLKLSPSLAEHIPSKASGGLHYAVLSKVLRRIFYTAYGIFG